MNTESTVTPTEAFERLLAGHRRFLAGTMEHLDRAGEARRVQVAEAQRPFAVVLACSDSRVSPTLLFDAGLGEIFNCRNAGNLLDELTVGSIEYGVVHAGASLVAIVGHSRCGAANAAVAFSRNPEMSDSHNVDDMLMRMQPAVEATRGSADADSAWADQAARANVRLMCAQLLERSPLLAELTAAGRVQVAGLYYHLRSGEVEVVKAPGEAPG